MSVRRPRWLCLALCLSMLTGCGGSNNGQPEAAGQDSRKGPPPPLAELLDKDRAELAQLCEDQLTEIRLRDKARSEGKLKFALLPKWVHLLVTPVFYEAKFIPSLGLSLPPYVNEKDLAKERQLCLHVARFGDHQAAVKIAGGGADPEIEKLRCERNYPVEWTRYVTLKLYGLQQRLATGDESALTELVDLHQQVDRTLDPVAKQGLLGQTLLPRGRRTLQLAAAAWRKANKPELADLTEAVLGQWPAAEDLPAFTDIGQPKSYWTFALKGNAEGRVVPSTPPARAFDLLQLPFPRDGADAVLFFFNSREQLEEVLVLYNPRIGHDFALAADLASALTDWLAPEKETDTLCVQQKGRLSAETNLYPPGAPVGGWVRFTFGRTTAEAPLTRQLGAVHLNRSFDANRLLLAPKSLGSHVKVTQPDALARAGSPLGAGKLEELVLSQVPEQNLLESARFIYPTGPTLNDLALPLFGQLGPAQLTYEGGDRKSTEGPAVRVAWQDAVTQIELRLPQLSREPTVLEISDRREEGKTAEWAALVAKQERAERRARLDAKQPEKRLPRKLEQFPLGMERAAVLRFLPRDRLIFRRDLPDGLMATINTAPAKDQVYMVRQVFLRFNKEDRLCWARLRYDGVPATQKKVDWTRLILDYWQSQGGVVAPIGSPLRERMTDLPPQAAPLVLRWQDDLTEVVYVRDSSGVEVTLQDRPENDAPATPFIFLARGPGARFPGLELGMPRTEFEAQLQGKPEPNADGSFLVWTKKGPFDAVIVWYEQDRVKRIAARYRQTDASKTSYKEMEKALSTQWAAELSSVGWPARRDASPQGVLQCFTWFDDQTRYRLYWAENDNTPPRLWSEWRDDRP